MPSKKPKCPIVVRQAKNKKTGLPILKWYYSTVGDNGEPMNTSELYTSKSNAVRGKDDLLNVIEKYLIAVGRVVSTATPTETDANGDVKI